MMTERPLYGAGPYASYGPAGQHVNLANLDMLDDESDT